LPSADSTIARVRREPTDPRSALQALEHEGLVIVRPRRGRAVRSSQRLRWHLTELERPDHTVLATADAWESDIERQGHDPTRQDLEVARITPPEAVAARLKLDPRTDICVVRRHIRYIDGKRGRSGRSGGHQRAELMAVSGQFLMSVDTRHRRVGLCGTGPERSRGLPAQATARSQLDLPVSEALS